MSLIDENWSCLSPYIIDDVKNCKDFENQVKNSRDEVVHLGGFNVQKHDRKNIFPSHDEELKILTEKNVQLRNEIEKKVEALCNQQSQYETYKQDKKLLSQEIKDTHEAFLMAKKYYKKYLKMYYTIESRNNDKQTIYLQFFTELKKETDNYYSVRLMRDPKSEHFELLETTPRLKMFETLKKTLQDTNDVAGVVCSIRQAMKQKKKI